MTGVMFVSGWLQMTTVEVMELGPTVTAAQPQSHELWKDEAQKGETLFFCDREKWQEVLG